MALDTFIEDDFTRYADLSTTRERLWLLTAPMNIQAISKHGKNQKRSTRKRGTYTLREQQKISQCAFQHELDLEKFGLLIVSIN